MLGTFFADLVSKFNKKNLEIGLDDYNRWYLSVSIFRKLFYIWLDNRNITESYFKHFMTENTLIDDSYYLKGSGFSKFGLYKSKLYFQGKINDKKISADIKEIMLPRNKSVYILTLSNKGV